MYGASRSAQEAAAEQRLKLSGEPSWWMEIMAKFSPTCCGVSQLLCCLFGGTTSRHENWW